MLKLIPGFVAGALVALIIGLALPRASDAVSYRPGSNELASLVAPTPPAPQHGATVTLNGSVETVFTGASGTCYLVSTNGKDAFFYAEDALNTGTAAVTDHRLPDPGIEKVCLVTPNTKLHFFASAATTVTVAQTGP